MKTPDWREDTLNRIRTLICATGLRLRVDAPASLRVRRGVQPLDSLVRLEPDWRCARRERE